jgi:hypothetical protein
MDKPPLDAYRLSESGRTNDVKKFKFDGAGYDGADVNNDVQPLNGADDAIGANTLGLGASGLRKRPNDLSGTTSLQL